MPAPLWEALVRHVASRPQPWHVPGHKMGRGAPPDLLQWLGPGLRLDLTELPGLDDLHHPEGPIAEAQRLAAEAVGADETFFLVGGSTAGNIAMVLAACRPGEEVLVSRHVHKSVIAGLALAGVSVRTVAPGWEEDIGVAGGVSPDAVERMLGRHPDIRAVLLTSPTYHGLCSDLTRIAEVVHRRGGLLLVDEAHGAHFSFAPGFPPSALRCGADASVQSWHKTAGSLTQSAMLLVRGERLDRDRLRRVLGMIQSSSPSYLLMASLDLARDWMSGEGGSRLAWVAEALAGVRAFLENSGMVKVLSAERAVAALAPYLDPARLTVGVLPSGRTGADWDSALRSRGVWAELAEPTAVTFVAGPGDDRNTVSRLQAVLGAVLEEMAGTPREEGEVARGQAEAARRWSAMLRSLWTEGLPAEEPLFPRWWFAGARWVPEEEAVGLISAQAVVPYPPGIPLLLPGERITSAHVDLLRLGRQLGIRVEGLPRSGAPLLAAASPEGGTQIERGVYHL